MTADPKVTLKFKWTQVSPDPHTVTMRNTLEPVEVFVEVEIPLKGQYVANTERIIKLQLDTNAKEDWRTIPPILTKEGLQFVVNELSLGDSQFEPEEEELDEEDWDDADNDDFGDDNEDFEDDEEW